MILIKLRDVAMIILLNPLTLYACLDEEERSRMAEGDPQSTEYLRYLQQPSQNMDDSGFFSIQVLQTALKIWNLDLTRISNPQAREAKLHPQSQNAFICNLQQHWFTIRKFGKQQWFNLNSIKSEPELITDTYLSIYLAQLEQEGYSIFVVVGELPKCMADQVIGDNPIVRKSYRSEQTQSGHISNKVSHQFVEKKSLQAALAAADKMNENVECSKEHPDVPINLDEIREKRKLYFDRKGNSDIELENPSSLANATKTTGMVYVLENIFVLIRYLL
ncbi:uncharacterized protein TRIADDRAFT_51826 [Trichoplax adhaerens]|uniref:ubiquitinyl hydrolase 1 n=1 Tax=Trichoplax adhaerens TaxID=10228 RepID=B3RKZ9_TRIAD|nr:hypothetical protein TRIADDRAFT_51826 [Trichoplax adhaerens]EDV29463.1 hypothetical protein TRIADDRAFT_51826 [Trichoplax adhaerens]|eukprot:XP_002108665.1 hypothetical protein TRIADDRAFT_51826 [Trichoplax adhaerens]